MSIFKTIFQLRVLRVIPISSAQALTIPALLALRLLWILNRKRSIALLKSRSLATLQHTWKKIDQIICGPIACENCFSTVIIGFEEVDEVTRDSTNRRRNTMLTNESRLGGARRIDFLSCLWKDLTSRAPPVLLLPVTTSFDANGLGPFYYKNQFYNRNTKTKTLCMKRAWPLRKTKRSLWGTQQGRTQNLGVVFQHRPRSNF